jgi:hypothetical protein
MRSPGGALGMTLDEHADLSNLTYSLMEIEQGDFVFLTTDGISDNYDPCVSGHAVSVKTPLLVRKSNEIRSEILPTSMTAAERHQSTLEHMKLSIDKHPDTMNALHICHCLLQHVIRLTDEQRRTIEQGVRENKDIDDVERNAFELDMHDKVRKLPGKLDHASIVAYQVK